MPQTLKQLGIRIESGEDVPASEVTEVFNAQIAAIKRE